MEASLEGQIIGGRNCVNSKPVVDKVVLLILE